MYIAIAIVVLLAAFLAYAATRPDSFRVERTINIQAPSDKIYRLIEDFHGWRSWSPWENIDPGLQRTYNGPTSGRGAIYEWEGKKAGKGRMEIMNVSPDWHVLIKLDFIKPFEGHNTAEFTLEPSSGVTKVTWAMYGPNTFMGKVMSSFVSMDKFLGKEFDKGLANLKSAAEKP